VQQLHNKVSDIIDARCTMKKESVVYFTCKVTMNYVRRSELGAEM